MLTRAKRGQAQEYYQQRSNAASPPVKAPGAPPDKQRPGGVQRRNRTACAGERGEVQGQIAERRQMIGETFPKEVTRTYCGAKLKKDKSEQPCDQERSQHAGFPSHALTHGPSPI